jgi:hypothetical protein
MKSINQDENSTQGKRKKRKKRKRGPNWFSPLSFIPSFGFASPAGLHS